MPVVWVELGTYANFRGVTDLLAPLTSAADLPTHPSMSIPYKSSTITDMVKQSSEMLHREQRSLWNVKQLVTKLRGDETWIPCGALNSDVDDVIFDIGPIYKDIIESELLHNATLVKGPTLVNGEAVAQKPAVTNKVTPSTFTANISGSRKNSGEKIHETPSKNIRDPPGVSESEPTVPGPDDAANGSYNDPGSLGDMNTNVDIKGELPSPVDKVLNGFSVGGNITVEDSRSLDSESHSSHVQFQSNKVGLNLGQGDPPNPAEDVSQREQDEAPVVDAATKIVTNGETNNRTNQGLNPSSTGALKEGSIGADDSGDAFQASRHRMQTRAQAQAKSENTPSSQTRSASPASWTPPVIHPLYLMPASAYPDRNFGLPPVEAEETRRMVTLYTQKQEEVCRSAEKLYVGLLRADRMRKTVFKWCKAEGHVGEMSDGEDWYDKEEWGLDEDLRKGQEEEEDDKDKEKDGTGPQAKKTRKTRVPTLK